MKSSRYRSKQFGGGPSSTALVGIGVALIVIGAIVHGQPWTTPDLFKGLELDLGKTIVNVGLFLVFIQVLNYFFYAPLKEAMDNRNHQLERTFTEAEDLRNQMTQMKSDYEQRLAKTEAEAREQIQNQIKEAQTLRTELMSEASAKADELVKRAQVEIEAEKAKVIGEIRNEVVNLTMTATEKILGETMNTERNRKLVEDFIQTVEAPR